MYIKYTLMIVSIISLLNFVGCNKPSDGSNESLSLPPNIEGDNPIVVNNPAGREIYSHGETILINWIKSSLVAKVDVYLYRKSRLIYKFNSSLDNTGEIMWQTPSDIPHSNHYKIKLVNSFNEKEFGYSGMFGIQSE